MTTIRTVEYEPVLEVLERVKKARERLHITDKQCPCAPKETGRGCVGAVCLAEIYSQGHCKCGAYRLTKETKDDTLQLDRRGSC